MASMVAIDWLQFAEKKISERKNPAKLSAIAYDQIRALADEKYWSKQIGAADLSEIAKTAVAIARSFLSSGRYPTVTAYFRGLAHGAKGAE